LRYGFKPSAEEIVAKLRQVDVLSAHLIAPYDDTAAPVDIPAPSVPLAEIGVKRWQYDLWFKIIEAALSGHPERVPP